MPIGIITKNISKHPSKSSVGCMNKLYASVGDLGVKYFRTEFCKTILRSPLNEVRDGYQKIKIDPSYPLWYYLCSSTSCTISGHKLVSYFENSVCDCGNKMTKSKNLFKGKQDGYRTVGLAGVFAKALVRQLITDDLQLLLASTTSSIDLLSRLGVTNYDALEKKTFAIGETEVLGLLKYSLMSNTPLTEVLLKPQAIVPELKKDDVIRSKHTRYQKKEHVSIGSKKISVRLVTNKSKGKVCYAEAGADFVDLLFSFLTIPLGYILKEMSNESSKGCMNRLYQIIQDIDADKYLKSVDIKNLLLNPKIAPCHGYTNHPLGLEEAKQEFYYHANTGIPGVGEMLTSDAELVRSGCTSKGVALSLKDPKSPHQKDECTGGGYIRSPAMFTVSDDLVVIPVSPVSALSDMKRLNVPFHDIEEKVVNVGKEEALRLLIAAFSSDSALTNAFLH